ncbi:virion structural protein [Pseudomonas phage PhiPA3]|uniref:Virion structural protein n=1 Tax=Pseudomonas phage PhiPA3 TaxID=998086 RepID=F8SK21_BPPA3|nr:virion structural protein [Pseudomonas phage PhiPA3]AEH03571.1 virion structural protein [Pseudomonas phage PhiPA3]
MQLLPDLELVETVYVGSIIDPKALSDTDLTFSVDQAIFDSELSKHLLEPVEKYFKRDYKIDERLDLILRDCLFRKGASILAVLPENVLDNLINGRRQVSMETFEQIRNRVENTTTDNLGFLGHPTDQTISLEGYANNATTNRIRGDKHLTVTDNFNVLKVPGMSRRVREMSIAKKLRGNQVSLEAEVHNFGNDEIEKLYQSRLGGTEHTQVVTSPRYMDRPSVGHPLILPLPMESVVPVFVQGRPHEHIGYFLLVDQHGYPISKDSTRDFYGELQAGWKGGKNSDNNSEVLRLTREALGNNTKRQDFEIDEIQQTYNAIIVNDLNNRLRNGMYDQELEIGITEEIQRIMLYRSWKAKNTQLVFIPAELLTYIAFDYNVNGIGETLLSRSKMIATMRSTLLMAETIGGMRNAVGRKRVNITLDPDDVDPEQTISNIQSNIMESAHRSFPLAAPDPTQAMDHLIRSGFDFAINTNGADYAETKVEYDDYNTSVNAGNPDLQDRLRRMHISGMGVPPEKVDPMSSPDFATSVVQNDLVMSRRVRDKQKTFCQHLSKFIRSFVTHSSIIREELNKIVTDNAKMLISPEFKHMTVQEVVDEFILSIEVSLPTPDNTQHERQSEALENYDRLLTTALESYITPELFPDELTQIPGLTDQVMNHVKAMFKRQFMAQNNILPELNILTEMDGDKPAFSLLDFAALQQGTMAKAFLAFAKHTQESKLHLEKLYKNVIEGNDENGITPGGGGDFGGGNDFGGGDEFSNIDEGGGDMDLGVDGGTGDGSEQSDDFGAPESDVLDEGTETDEDKPQTDGLEDPMAEAEAEENGKDEDKL